MASHHKKIGQETRKLIHYIHRHAYPEQQLITETITKTRSLGALVDGWAVGGIAQAYL